MKRASYRFAVWWIAINDGNGEAGRLDPNDVQGMISVALVADLFAVDDDKVAEDVVLARVKSDSESDGAKRKPR